LELSLAVPEVGVEMPVIINSDVRAYGGRKRTAANAHDTESRRFLFNSVG